MLFTHTRQLEIRGIDSKQKLITSPFATANLYKSAHYLLYNFDVQSIHYIVSWYKNLNKVCQNQTEILSPLTNEIEANMKWAIYKPFNLKGENLKRIHFHLLSNEVLEQNINWFNSDVGEYACIALRKLALNFVKLSQHLNELFNGNAKALMELMSLEHLSIDVQDIVNDSKRNNNDSSSSFTYPFDFSNNFPEKFFQFTRFSYYQDNYTISLLFEIPFYETVFLNRIHTIPIVINLDPYILKSFQKYVIEKNGIQIFYDDQTLDSHCFWSDKRRFCYMPIGNRDCERDYMNQVYSKSECLEKLPRKNMITQIVDKTYFTIFEPLVVQIHCLESDFLLKILSDLKFDNNLLCSINTTFFEYGPQKLSQGLFISQNENEIIDFSDGKYVKLESYLNFVSLVAMALFNVLTLIAAFFYCKRRVEEAKLRERVTIRLNGMFAPYVPSVSAGRSRV